MIVTGGKNIPFLLEESDSFLTFDFRLLEYFKGENFVRGLLLDDLDLAEVSAADRPHDVEVGQRRAKRFDLAEGGAATKHELGQGIVFQLRWIGKDLKRPTLRGHSSDIARPKKSFIQQITRYPPFHRKHFAVVLGFPRRKSRKDQVARCWTVGTWLFDRRYFRARSTAAPTASPGT